jgi:hypothetical protein
LVNPSVYDATTRDQAVSGKKTEIKPEDADALGNKAGLHTTLFPVKCVLALAVKEWSVGFALLLGPGRPA